MFNRIETVTGPRGNQTRGLRQQISYNVNGTNGQGASSEQNEFQFLPKREDGDLYLSFWLKLQPDLAQKMATDYWGNNGTWRAIFAFKTGGQTTWGGPANNGDYRVEAYVRSSNGQLFWSMLGDNNAGGGAPLVNSWNLENRNVPVPVNQWFKLEFFWHRSNGSDGRIWMAANGQVIADRRGPNMGAWNMPINRIIAPMLYTGSAMPVYQWVDDLEVWSGFPPGSGDDPPRFDEPAGLSIAGDKLYVAIYDPVGGNSQFFAFDKTLTQTGTPIDMPMSCTPSKPRCVRSSTRITSTG